MNEGKKTERAKRAVAQELGFTHDEVAVAHFAGSSFVLQRSWGSAPLHPRAGAPAEHLGWGARLYAIAALRGLNANSSATCSELRYYHSDPHFSNLANSMVKA